MRMSSGNTGASLEGAGVSNVNQGTVPTRSAEIDYAYSTLDDYLDKLYKRGRKATTLTTYYHIIDVQIKFLVENQLHCSPGSIGETEINAIIKKYPDISDWTRKYYINVLSKWVKTMAGNDVVRKMDLLWPTSERPNRTWAVYDEALNMYDSEYDPCNKMIIVLAMEEGMRAGEISAVRMSDIHDGWIRIRGKGHGEGKIRSMPLSDRVKDTLNIYLRVRSRIVMKYGDNGRLLLTKKGKEISAHNITVRVIRMSQRSGYDITAHSLRRRFITDTLNSGVKIEVCAKMVGHENPMITALYYKCEADSITDAMGRRVDFLNGKMTGHEAETPVWKKTMSNPVSQSV